MMEIAVGRHKIRAEHLVQLALLLGCLGGFVWLTFGVMDKYLKGATFVSTSYIRDKNPFPDIVFCPNKGFDPSFAVSNNIDPAFAVSHNITFLETLSKEKYAEVAEPAEVVFVNIEDDVKEMGGLQLNLNQPTNLNVNMIKVPTYYNGLCQVFQMDQNIPAKVYLRFSIAKPHWMMLTGRNQFIYLIEQQWYESPPITTDIISDLMVEYER